MGECYNASVDVTETLLVASTISPTPRWIRPSDVFPAFRTVPRVNSIHPQISSVYNQRAISSAGSVFLIHNPAHARVSRVPRRWFPPSQENPA